MALLVMSSCGSRHDLTATTEAITATTIASTDSTVAMSTTAPTSTSTAETTPVTDAPATSSGVESTLASSLTDAPLCSVDELELLPTADGAMGTLYGGLAVHNIGAAVCEVRGVPVIELVADDGTVVQSTDPVNDANDAAPVVLEPNSWAEASLGVIGSNVCGGNQSSQLKFHWNGQIITVPFAIGRPPDLESCVEFDEKGPGHLQPIGTDRVAFAPLSSP